MARTCQAKCCGRPFCPHIPQRTARFLWDHSPPPRCRYHAAPSRGPKAPQGALWFLNLLSRCPLVVVLVFVVITIPFVVFLAMMKVTSRFVCMCLCVCVFCGCVEVSVFVCWVRVWTCVGLPRVFVYTSA